MQQAINPDTGESLFLVGNQWVKPDQTAVNDAGDKAYLVGKQWITGSSGTAKQTASNAPIGTDNPIPGANGEEDKYRLDKQTVSLGAPNNPRVEPINKIATPLDNIKDIGSNIASGVVHFGEMAAKSAKALAPLIANYNDYESSVLNQETPLNKEDIDKNTQSIRNASEKVANYLGGVAKNIEAPERTRSTGAEVLVHGATNVGMAIPAVVASMFGAPEALVAGGMGLIFGGSSYQDKSKAVIDHGGTEEEAHHAGLLSGVINGFGGAAVSYLTAGLGSVVKNTIGKEATPTMDGVVSTLTNQDILKPFVKGFATRLAADPIIFNAQSLADREVDKAYDLPYEKDISKVIKQATGDGVAMAVLSSPLGAYGSYKSAKYRGAFGEALNNPVTPEALRAQAAMTAASVAKKAGVPVNQVNDWLGKTAQAIMEKKPLSSQESINEPSASDSDNRSPIIRQMDLIRPIDSNNPEQTGDKVNGAPTVDAAIKAAQDEVNAPYAHEDAQVIVDEINSKLSTGQISLVRSSKDLPDGVIQSRDSEGNLVEGVYSGNGNVHIVSDNIESKNRLHQVIAHELIGHLAPEEIIQPKIYQSAIQSVIAMEKAKNQAIVELGQSVDKSQPNLDPTTRAKEIMAMAVETGSYRNSPVLRRVVGNITYSVKKYLLSKGIDASWVRKLTDQEIHAMLREGERRLYSGKANIASEKSKAPDTSNSEKLNNAFMWRKDGVDVPIQVVAEKLGTNATGQREIVALVNGEEHRIPFDEVVRRSYTSESSNATEPAIEVEKNIESDPKSEIKDASEQTVENKEYGGNTPLFSKKHPESIDIDGINRPTQNSEGQPIHANEEGIRNFWRWYDEGENRLQAKGGNRRQDHGSSDERFRTGENTRREAESGSGVSSGSGTFREDGSARYENRSGETRRLDSREDGTGADNRTQESGSKEISRGNGTLDETGRPRVFYHGTSDDFHTFDIDHPNRKDKGWLGRGVYLSSDPWVAESYSERKKGRSGGNQSIMPVYAGVRNPKIVDTKTKDRLSKVSQSYIDAWTNQVKKEGHDGVLLDINGTQELVVFDNNRVKSVTGNTGEFNNENPSILYSRKQSTKDAYEKRIDELHEENPSVNAFKGVKVLDRSDVLDMLGYGNMPVNLAESKVVDGRYKHGLTALDWKKVPEWIDHPVAVFDSETSPGRLVFIAPETVKGAPVRLILDPSSNHQGFDAHILINAYDAKGMTPSMRWFRDGLLRFIDNKKSQSFAETSGLRLPNKSQQITSSGSKILTEGNLVKYRKQNSENEAPEAGGGIKPFL